VAILDPAEYRIRPGQPVDGQAAYDLACLVTPRVQQWLQPIPAGQYRLDWWTRLGQWFTDLMATRRTYRLVALKEDRLVAAMSVTAAFHQGDHHLTMLVHPDHAGRVEAALVSRALHLLEAAPAWPVRATVDMGHTALLRVLREYGFEQRGTLLTLRRDLA
jgi:hypothetical protein